MNSNFISIPFVRLYYLSIQRELLLYSVEYSHRPLLFQDKFAKKKRFQFAQKHTQHDMMKGKNANGTLLKVTDTIFQQ